MGNIIADKYLFDEVLFRQKLKEQNEPLAIFKSTLKYGYHYLTEEFESGKDIELIVKKQGWFIDQLLIISWQQFNTSKGFTLVAVGG